MDKNSVKIKKLNRKKLALILILTEILGILTLVWYLKTPLTLKYLTFPAQKYSLNSLDLSKQYIMRRGDFISGNIPSSASLELLFLPGEKKYSISTNSKGEFEFQIPEDIKEGTYEAVIYDTDNTNAPLEKLKIRIESNNRIKQYSKLVPFL